MNFHEIYEKSFENQNYNFHPENEFRYSYVKNYVESNKVKKIIDIGSGRGTLIEVLKKIDTNIEIFSSDLKKFHNWEVPFFEINLCNKETFKEFEDNSFELLVCLDVLEHIKKECIDDIFSFFQKISKNLIFSIANHSDVQNGVELHLIQEDMSFWSPIILKYFEIIHSETQYGGKLYLLTLKSKTI